MRSLSLYWPLYVRGKSRELNLPRAGVGDSGSEELSREELLLRGVLVYSLAGLLGGEFVLLRGIFGGARNKNLGLTAALTVSY